MSLCRTAVSWFICTAAMLAAVLPARAQLPPNARFSTIASGHFRVTYADGLDDLARHAAASAERAYAALDIVIGKAPPGTIDIVLTDNVDFSNGSASPLPSNRIVVFAKPAVDALELQYTRDWIDLVLAHELAHIFHLDTSGAVGRAVRAVFGRVPSPWPVFPVLGTPLWSLEGFAVHAESSIAGFGRIHGSYHEMIVRTAALEADIDEFDRLSSTTPVWPGGMRYYIYGSLFADYIARRYGPDAVSRIVRTTAGVIVPPPLWFGNVANHALGLSFREAYADWRRELQLRYDTISTRITAAGLTTSSTLTAHGRIAHHPRFSPDSRSIAYARNDGRTQPRSVVIDALSGAVQWTRTRNDVGPLAWLSDSTLITADLQYEDRFYVHSDLYITARRERDRLTHDARLQEPDVSGDGRVVAVQNGGGTNRLVLVDRGTGEIRALTAFDPHTHWALPRWAPDGERIAVGRWLNGGRYDIVVIDTSGNVMLEVTDGIGINTGAAWSPDGRWLVFTSDRTGVSNLYAADVAFLTRTNSGSANGARPRLRQITNVLTGVFFPDVSPEGSAIVFAVYHHDGYHLERMPFDTTTWREPQPATLPQLSTERPSYAVQNRPDDVDDAIAAAVAAADTTTGPVSRYAALRHARPRFWLPIMAVHADDAYLGLYSYGTDLVRRHDWEIELAVAPGSGRTAGDFSYAYRGLPVIEPLGVHPTLSIALDRDWDEVGRVDSLGLHIDEREDNVSLALGLNHVRWRSSASLSIAGELVRRSRHLFNAPANARLTDPDDNLIGMRASAVFATYVSPALAISRENGVVLQVAGRTRHDRDPRQVPTTSGGTVTIDNSYSELTTWNAAYLALPFHAFARHVVAARFSMLYRDGPGAGTSGIGEASGNGFGISDIFEGLGGSSRLLPVRGFPANTRRGTRAWTASAEYRAPLAIVLHSLAPLPIYFDRLAGSIFADAGHAWCDAQAAGRLRSCISTSPWSQPLVSAGAELTAFLSVWGAGVPLRLSAGIPLQGGNAPRLHVLAGAAF